jgi:hypothetical protein
MQCATLMLPALLLAHVPPESSMYFLTVRDSASSACCGRRWVGGDAHIMRVSLEQFVVVSHSKYCAIPPGQLLSTRWNEATVMSNEGCGVRYSRHRCCLGTRQGRVPPLPTSLQLQGEVLVCHSLSPSLCVCPLMVDVCPPRPTPCQPVHQVARDRKARLGQHALCHALCHARGGKTPWWFQPVPPCPPQISESPVGK